MFQQDAAELAPHLGCLLGKMRARDDPLGRRAVEVRAAVLDNAVSARHAADHGDDRVVRNGRVDRDSVESGQNRAVGPQVADGIERGPCSSGEITLGPFKASISARCAVCSWARAPGGSTTQPTGPSAIGLPRCGAAMNTTRRTNGKGSKTRRLSRVFRSSGVARNRSWGTVIAASQSFEPSILSHHLGEQTAHAVTNEDHLVERTVVMAGVDRIAGRVRTHAAAGPRRESASPSDRGRPRTDTAPRSTACSAAR